MNADEILKKWDEEAKEDAPFLTQARRVRALIAALRIHRRDIDKIMQYDTADEVARVIEEAERSK